jgi:AcrR family transcriptional regulator
MARTQQQRREETVARLLDASIDTIADIGYARASAAVICKRAGVSVGALFRHFETMGDFMAATAREVLRRQIEEFTKRVAEIPSEADALEPALAIMGDVIGNRTHSVMRELEIAARTDEKLKETLTIVLEQIGAKICDVARTLPGIEALPEERIPALAAIITNLFDGAAIVRDVLPQPDLDAQRIRVIAALLRSQLSQSVPTLA